MTEISANNRCPVCEAGTAGHFASLDGRDYLRCAHCGATFLAPWQRLPRQDELAHYLHHENDPSDAGYRRFLSRLADPLRKRLAPGARGLDYGCGPGPALAVMLREAGYDMALYDPFFHSDPAPLAGMYDFVTCTEVAEHFHAPAREFARLRALVRPGGWLALMTSFQTRDDRFAYWHYRKDPTHVVFYKARTFRTLAAVWGWTCEMPVKNVVLMQRPGDWP